MNNPNKIAIIGAGIMGSTLTYLISKLMPDTHITLLERLPHAAMESSDVLHNAGTGHAGFCELNYTPQDQHGEVHTAKAIHIAKQFEMSREFWAHLVQSEVILNPQSFIHTIPHIGLVWGEDQILFLKRRQQVMSQHPLFSDLIYSDNKNEITEAIPLLGDPSLQPPMAMNKMEIGTDVNYGSIASQLVSSLRQNKNIDYKPHHEVDNLTQVTDNQWKLDVTNKYDNTKSELMVDFIFVAAGGGTLRLLEKSGIEEIQGYGGFPLSGQWLLCKNEYVINKHHAKVYGKALDNAPPIAAPHLDTRIIDGKRALLFGAFSGLSPKFLKYGSNWDFLKSINLKNIAPLLSAGRHNIVLTQYLISQLRLSFDDKINVLKQYIPDIQADDWEIKAAGQRVQIIKKDKHQGGILQFGTELIFSEDRTISGLLGASPGASTSVAIMIEVLKNCFATSFNSDEWRKVLSDIIPSYYQNMDKPETVNQSRKRSASILQLQG